MRKVFVALILMATGSAYAESATYGPSPASRSVKNTFSVFDEILENHPTASPIILVGQNRINGNDCYLRLARGSSLLQSSLDRSGLRQVLRADASVKTAFDRKGNLLFVNLEPKKGFLRSRGPQKLFCVYDLKSNLQTPPAPAH